MATSTREFLDTPARGLLRPSLDFLEKRTEKVIADPRAVRLPAEDAEALLSDIAEVRVMVPTIGDDSELTRAQKGCIAAALACYLDELDKTAKSETKIGVPTHATDARRFEIGAIAQRLDVVTPG